MSESQSRTPRRWWCTRVYQMFGVEKLQLSVKPLSCGTSLETIDMNDTINTQYLRHSTTSHQTNGDIRDLALSQRTTTINPPAPQDSNWKVVLGSNSVGIWQFYALFHLTSHLLKLISPNQLHSVNAILVKGIQLCTSSCGSANCIASVHVHIHALHACKLIAIRHC